jgi:hypothetical protein
MIPDVLPTTPIKAVQVAILPKKGFLKTHDAIYRDAASP